MTIRKATGTDAGSIVETIRSGFDQERIGMTIYGCEGIERYVARLLELPAGSADTAYTVATSATGVVGAVEMRLLPDALFLNYISIAPEYRERHLGSSLLLSAIEADRTPCRQTIALDVFGDNVAACRWYERLGFTEVMKTEAWEVPLPDGGEPNPELVIAGWPRAEASQSVFGFSSFTVRTTAFSHEVGRLGRRWFRVTSSDALTAPGLPFMLRLLEPTRTLLALLPEGQLPASFAAKAMRLAVSRRLTAALDTVLDRLR